MQGGEKRTTAGDAPRSHPKVLLVTQADVLAAGESLGTKALPAPKHLALEHSGNMEHLFFSWVYASDQAGKVHKSNLHSRRQERVATTASPAIKHQSLK